MTSSAETVDWNTGQKSGLVFIGTHKLFLHVTGPDRTTTPSHQPVLVLLPGVTNTIAGWTAIQRLTSPFVRLVAYNRSGLGSSEKSPDAPSSTTIARELDALLNAAGIGPPYILLGHSWGGILALEFLAVRPLEDVAGIVFVDAAQGRYLGRIPFMDPAIQAVNRSFDWYEVIGLREDSRDVLTDEEYAAFMDAERDPRAMEQRIAEFIELLESYGVSKARGFLGRNPPLLGSRPVCVVKGHNVRDLERAYRAGVEKGNGTEEDRARYLEILETWDERETELQRELLTLSSKGLFLTAGKGGHNVHMADPGAVVEGVRWTLDNLDTK